MGGGFYRYRLGDRVEVTGFARATPMLRFLGKEDGVSDLVGEKLHPGFVASLIRRIVGSTAVRFAMLAPERIGAGWQYLLFLETRGSLPARAAEALETGLRENPHYRYAVELGQLRPSGIRLVTGDAFAAYAARCTARGLGAHHEDHEGHEGSSLTLPSSLESGEGHGAGPR
jgi:hypothetical protein